MCIWQFQSPDLSLPPSFSPGTCVCFLYLWFCFMNNLICTIFFKIPHISDIICVFLWLHSVWQSLGPFMLLQMALFVLFNSWIVFYYIYMYVPHRLSLFHCQWIFRLLPYSGYVNSAAMNMGCTLHGFLICLVSFFLFYICSPCNGFYLP